MIPKIIHYVWVGGNPLPPLAEKCIESWKKYCPDYEIKRWDETNFDINQNLFCKQAYESKKWAFVSDYIRLKVLYEYGGVYMDTDVEVIKPIDGFLKHPAFSGFECTLKIPTGIIAAEKNNHWIKLMLDYYNDKQFVNSDGTFELVSNVIFMSELTKKNYKIEFNDKFQDLNDIVFYPHDYFCPYFNEEEVYTTENTYTIHHFASSWLPKGFLKKKKRKAKFKKCVKKVLAFFIGKKKLESIMSKRRDKLAHKDVDYSERYKKLKNEEKSERN